MENKSHSHYVTIYELAMEDVLPFIGPTTLGFPRKRKYVVGEETFSVNMNSIRLVTFKNSLVCVGCGIVGSKFVLERQRKADRLGLNPHLNLYAQDSSGKWIMMTKDHIVPRSKGGKNSLSNLQTMCFVCNELKGNEVTNITASSVECIGLAPLDNSLSKT